MFKPNNEMLEFKIGDWASVRPLEKSAVVVPSGKTPPTHEPDALKLIGPEPCTQVTACAELHGNSAINIASTPPKTRPTPPRNAEKSTASGNHSANRCLTLLFSDCF
jgi:hypothetical protein